MFFKLFLRVFYLESSQIQLESTQIHYLSAFFAIQPIRDARGRLTKRPRADTPPFQASDNDSFGENGDYSLKSRGKRSRKASELPQFGVYHHETSTPNSLTTSALKK
jgi:hypothetical protein